MNHLSYKTQMPAVVCNLERCGYSVEYDDDLYLVGYDPTFNPNGRKCTNKKELIDFVNYLNEVIQ